MNHSILNQWIDNFPCFIFRLTKYVTSWTQNKSFPQFFLQLICFWFYNIVKLTETQQFNSYCHPFFKIFFSYFGCLSKIEFNWTAMNLGGRWAISFFKNSSHPPQTGWDTMSGFWWNLAGLNVWWSSVDFLSAFFFFLFFFSLSFLRNELPLLFLISTLHITWAREQNRSR